MNRVRAVGRTRKTEEDLNNNWRGNFCPIFFPPPPSLYHFRLKLSDVGARLSMQPFEKPFVDD